MEECGYLCTAKQLNKLSYLLYSGFGWIRMEVCVAQGESATFDLLFLANAGIAKCADQIYPLLYDQMIGSTTGVTYTCC